MPRRKKSESEKIEEKSRFTGNVLMWLKLVKTVVALANTRGGELRLYNTEEVDPKKFDSAKIDDKVNKYIEPRIQNIKTLVLKSYVKIIVENSPSKPHVFKMDGPYQDPDNPSRQRKAFYKGQVLVRHSSKNEPATRDDYEHMFKEKQSEFVRRLNLVSQLPIDRPVKIEESPEALPVKIVEEGEGIPTLMKEVVGKGKDVRVTSDPTAPVVRLEEKDVRDKYPLSYAELTKSLKGRYSDFKINAKYYKLKRSFEKDKSLCFTRYLDPRNPKSSTKKFYSTAIYKEFDKHYSLKRKRK